MYNSIRRMRFIPYLISVLIGLQAGLGMVPAYGAREPVIPGYYGSDVSRLVPPSVYALPQLREVVQNATVSQTSDNALLVNQTEDYAIIDWDSFDIGAQAHTRFNQQGYAAWKVLNRIYDENPSQIFGNLTADGYVYLLNSNGMVFGENSVVNVHGLVASALDLKMDDFLSDTRHFVGDESVENLEEKCIINHGTIQTDLGGSVILTAPQVINTGTIEAPLGWVVLAAGTDVSMAFSQGKLEVDSNSTDPDQTEDYVVQNEEGGRIYTELGNIQLYGSCVNQQGLAQTVTAVRENGEIIIKAGQRIITGENSQTLNTISSSDEEVHSSFSFNKGTITLDSGGTIEHEGEIVCPAGTVDMDAKTRIYLESGSRIDVSGVTADLDAEDGVVTATLNSVELRDEYLQKNGILLGEDVTFPSTEGSTIGDVSGYLEKEYVTAAEYAVKGGGIYMDAPDGDIIVREGAELDIPGGSTHYEAGVADMTWLVSGNRAYSISNAPDTITYDAVLNDYNKRYTRYGITETYSGVNTGGGVAVMTRVGDYYTGEDAGLLKMNAETIVLDGILDGSILPGFYQTEEDELVDEMGNTYTRGLEEPVGGRLTIGSSMEATQDAKDSALIVSQVVVSDSTETLDENFTAESSLSEVDGLLWDYTASDGIDRYKTILSASLLNDAGLSTLEIGSNTSIDILKGSTLTLNSNGTFRATGRSIYLDGEINVPSGEVRLLTTSTHSAYSEADEYISVETFIPERVYLDENARITTAGETEDNSLVKELGMAVVSASVDGGEIKLLDQSNAGEGVILRNGSLLDVSGGYEIDTEGNIQGGDAGTVTLQGNTLVLDGDFLAYSLEGNTGGKIELFASAVDVDVTDKRGPLPDDFDRDDPLNTLGEDWQAGLVLDDNRFDDSGFTRFVLKSTWDTTFAQDVSLGPSLVKLASPLSSVDGDVDRTGERNLVRVNIDEIGDSSIALSAGNDMSYYHESSESYTTDALVTVKSSGDPDRYSLYTGPEGRIAISGPNVTVDGVLCAPAGTIDLSSKFSGSLGNTSKLLAKGYNLPDKDSLSEDGSVTYTVLDGGSVSVSGLTLEDGFTIDVSGGDAVSQIIQGSDGQSVVQLSAGNPGSVYLSVTMEDEDSSTLNGTILASHADIDGLTGGSLSLGLNRDFVISEDLIEQCLSRGFDALSLSSNDVLTFGEISRSATLGADGQTLLRSLTLDAPEITVDDLADTETSLYANYIELLNSTYYYGQGEAWDLVERSSLNLVSSGYISLTGEMDITGFSRVSLNSGKDIILSDKNYSITRSDGSNDEYVQYYSYGELNVNGDLTLEAARIYPETNTDFTIHSDAALTTVGVADPDAGDIYSAGGRLVVEAPVIVHGSTFAAPMGEIVICGDNGDETDVAQAESVTLLDGSSVDVSGSVAVNYGYYDEDTMVWQYEEKSGTRKVETFAGLKNSAITISAQTVESQEGSTLDVSGGGSVFTYLWRKSTEGSVDILSCESTYILLPVSAVSEPGETIWLSGIDGVPEGAYVVLSGENEAYAFAEGALIVEDLGMAETLYGPLTSKDGYDVSIGYWSALGQDGYATTAHSFVVRDATEVLLSEDTAEGDYSYQEMAFNNGGSLTVSARTNLLSATLYGAGVDNGDGGTLDLSATWVLIAQNASELDDDMSLANLLFIDADAVTGSGFDTVTLGDVTNTNRVEVVEGTQMSVENIILNARDEIIVGKNAGIDTGYDGTGIIELNTPDGQLILSEGSTIQAGEQLTVNGASMDIQGSVGVDSGTLTVQTDKVFFTTGSSESSVEEGIAVNSDLWAMLSSAETFKLISNGEITLSAGLTLETENAVVLDSRAITVTDSAEGVETSLTAGTLELKNNGTKEDGIATIEDRSGTLTLEGTESLSLSFAARGDDNEEEGDVSRILSVDGVTDTLLVTNGTMSVKGQGDFETASGDLEIEASAIVGELSMEPEQDGDIVYTTPDVVIRAALGDIRTIRNTNDYDTPVYTGGSLAFEAQSIVHGSALILPAGQVTLASEGDDSGDGIHLLNGSLIDVSGTESALSGDVILSSASGDVSMAEGSIIDLSAGYSEEDGYNGEAGTLKVSALNGDFLMNGDLAAHGGGGSFYLEADDITDVSGLATTLTEKGLDNTLYLRALTGNLVFDSNVKAQSLTVTADSGMITIKRGATLSASGDTGGEIILNAGGNLALESGSTLDASGTEGDGGEVTMSSRSGLIRFEGETTTPEGDDVDAAEINVSGFDGYNNGTVTFVASRVDTDEIDEPGYGSDDSISVSLDGVIKGADAITIEGRKVYDENDTYISENNLAEDHSLDLDNDLFNNYLISQTESFLRTLSVDGLISGLTVLDNHGIAADEADICYATAGIEIQNNGDIDLEDSIDLNEFWNAMDHTALSDQVTPGTLALRAEGNLTLNGSLLSHASTDLDNLSSSYDTLTENTAPDSWNLVLVAGADMGSADITAMVPDSDSGTLTIADGAMVYTESGDIDFVSALDTKMVWDEGYTYSNSERNFYYLQNAIQSSLATFDGDISGQVGGTLELDGGVIQSGTGDISLTVGKDINSQNGGSIRTTGKAPEESLLETYPTFSQRYQLTWLFENGGDIDIDVGGNIWGKFNSKYWDATYADIMMLVGEGEYEETAVWSADYGINGILSAGDTTRISEGIVTMAGGDIAIDVAGSFRNQAGTFGEGDLSIQAGGNLDGRFLVSDGTGTLVTAQSLGTDEKLEDQTLELGDAQLTVYAQGAILMGGVVSPSLTNVDSYLSDIDNLSWVPGYTSSTSVFMTSSWGDMELTGDAGYVSDNMTKSAYNNYSKGRSWLPASVSLDSGGDMRIGSIFSLFPSESGNLSLVADGNIEGTASTSSVRICDRTDSIYETIAGGWSDIKDWVTEDVIRESELLHTDDPDAVVIQAEGDILNLDLYFVKQARISAEGDIINMLYFGQNINDDDLTVIRAGGDIVYGTDPSRSSGNDNNTGIEISGPGTLMVVAGDSIDLGNSTGIVTLGNDDNEALPSEGSDLIILCGYDNPFSIDNVTDETESFFDYILEQGTLYTDALGEDDTEVDAHVDNVAEYLAEILGDDYKNQAGGDINMVQSQIATKQGGDISIIAAGIINVGETALSSDDAQESQPTGINCQQQGEIRIYAVGDINVNESRLMTWFGSDILIWTEEDINAGRGARTEVSPGKTVWVVKDGEVKKTMIPAAVGSGIRALTYDPDGLAGSDLMPDPGNVYLFAPDGIIDAGEAGIVGSLVYLGAKTVLNVQNISFSQGAVGVPMGADSSVNLGAITGSSGLTAGNQAMDAAAALAAVNKDLADSAEQMEETFLPTWLRVEFMGFDVDDRGI